MSKLENLTAYTVVEKKELKEVNGYGYILSHNKTKARVAVIENDDTNKVFTIGFRTPPADDRIWIPMPGYFLRKVNM